MNRRDQDRKSLIISLLLHLIFLLFVAFFGFKRKKLIILSKAAQAKQQKKEHFIPVALIPKRSDQGKKLVFDKANVTPEQKSQPKPEKPTPQPKPVKKVAEKKPPEVKNEVEQVKPKQLAVPKKKIAQITSRIPELKPKESTYAKATADREKEAKKEIEKPKRKSLLSLTKCFLDHEDGNSAMCRRGVNRMPTFEEMKYICYEKQIQDALVASWKVLYAGFCMPIQDEARFTFLVNEQCRAEDIILVKSSGNHTFDKMVLESVRQASFPPIPKHFGVKKYRPQGGVVVLR